MLLRELWKLLPMDPIPRRIFSNSIGACAGNVEKALIRCVGPTKQPSNTTAKETRNAFWLFISTFQLNFVIHVWNMLRHLLFHLKSRRKMTFSTKLKGCSLILHIPTNLVQHVSSWGILKTQTHYLLASWKLCIETWFMHWCVPQHVHIGW